MLADGDLISSQSQEAAHLSMLPAPIVSVLLFYSFSMILADCHIF